MLPPTAAAWPTLTVTVKTAVTPLSLSSQVRAALARIDPDQPVSRIRTMDRVVLDSLGSRRFPMLLLGWFSAVALALAAIGVYGVVSYSVAQRTREIGIRMALGARAPQVTGLVVRRALVPIGAGLACGVVASLAASRLLATLLYRVTPGTRWCSVDRDGARRPRLARLSFLRAASVDPLIALRDE